MVFPVFRCGDQPCPLASNTLECGGPQYSLACGNGISSSSDLLFNANHIIFLLVLFVCVYESDSLHVVGVCTMSVPLRLAPFSTFVIFCSNELL